MNVIQDAKYKGMEGGYLYPVTRRGGCITKQSVGCGPFPKDFGSREAAEKVIAELKELGFTTTFIVVKI